MHRDKILKDHGIQHNKSESKNPSKCDMFFKIIHKNITECI